MDTITHGIVGALCGKALFAGRDVPAAGSPTKQAESSPTARAAIVACTLGAMFPDIDTFAGPLARNPLAILEWHRNISHSVVMLPVWALLLAGLALPLARWAGWKAPPYFRLVAIFGLGIATHIFLDVITNFGTMVWSPLNYSRAAWDWIFIVDLTFTGIALVPQLAAWCYREPQKFARRAVGVWIALGIAAGGVYLLAGAVGAAFSLWVVAVASAGMAIIIFLPGVGQSAPGFRWTRAGWSRAGLAVACLYLAGTAVAHGRALAYTREFAAANHLDVKTIAALPLPPTFTQWAGMIETPQGVERFAFRLPDGVREGMVFYSDSPQDRYVEEAKQLRDVQIYLWFARFPIWQVDEEGSDTVVAITDARFFRDVGNTESGEILEQRGGARPANGAGFTFEVVFDRQGRVVYQGMRPPRP